MNANFQFEYVTLSWLEQKKVCIIYHEHDEHVHQKQTQ